MRAIFAPFRPLFDLFREPTKELQLSRLRAEAETQHIDHQTMADHHQALAEMYRRRVDWVDTQLEAQQPKPLRLAA